MDIITLVAVSLLVTERIVYHIITGIRHCKSKCCCSCNITKDHDSKALALQEWRYPRIYRTIYAKEPGAIFQADIMELYPHGTEFSMNMNEMSCIDRKIMISYVSMFTADMYGPLRSTNRIILRLPLVYSRPLFTWENQRFSKVTRKSLMPFEVD
jgi:hypothetical protein